jgi:hypothetical protein
MPYKSRAQAAYFNIHRKEMEAQGVTFNVVGECWECSSHKPNNSGYPCRHGGTLNRFVYRWCVGNIPDGMCVLHTCDNRLCLNPDHLWLGTHADNQKDKIFKCRQARNSGEKNGRAKLTEEQVMAIRESKETIIKTAERYGVSNQLVSRIRRREAWNAI